MLKLPSGVIKPIKLTNNAYVGLVWFDSGRCAKTKPSLPNAVRIVRHLRKRPTRQPALAPTFSATSRSASTAPSTRVT